MDKKVGQSIKSKRLELGMTQIQLAAKIRVSLDTISGLESGRKKSVSTTLLELIGKELNVKFEI